MFSTRYDLSQVNGPRYFPRAQFSSLKFVEWDEFTYRYASPLLLGNTRLKTLHISGNRRFTTIAEDDIGDEDSLPPIEELCLQYYDWDHSQSIIHGFWNWTGLRSLELKRVPITRFCHTVSADNFSQLEVLRTDGYCFDHSDWPEATRLLSNLISNIRGLHELSLTCHVGYQCCVSSILKHGRTLHTLELRSYCEPLQMDLSERVSQMRVETVQLNSIRSMCPHLTDLVLDHHPGVCSTLGFVGAATVLITQ